MKYRVWCIVNVPHPAVQFPVADVESAKAAIKTMVEWQLKDASIWSNVFGMEVEDKLHGWMEWEDENGRSITDVMDEEEE